MWVSCTDTRKFSPRWLLAPRRRAAQPGDREPERRGMLVGPLLDHLIRPLQERRRHREPEGLGGLEVDDQLALRRLFDREIAGLGASKDAVDIRSGALPKMLAIVTIGHEPPGFDILSRGKDRRQPVPAGGGQYLSPGT